MGISVSRAMRGLLVAVAVGATTFGALTASAYAAPAHRDPLAKLTADKIAAKAIGDLKSASSFHFRQSFKAQGQTYTVSLSVNHHGCTGKFTLGDMGGAVFLEIGSTVYLQPDDQFWTFAGVPAADLGTVHGMWIEITGAFGSPGSPNPELCAAKEFASEFGLQSKNLIKGKTAKVAGHSALQLKGKKGLPSYYVTISSTPEFLTANSRQQGMYTFSAYGAKVTLTAPPASEILQDPPTGTGPTVRTAGRAAHPVASVIQAVQTLLARG
jgi:hypothetical protein